MANLRSLQWRIAWFWGDFENRLAKNIKYRIDPNKCDICYWDIIVDFHWKNQGNRRRSEKSLVRSYTDALLNPTYWDTQWYLLLMFRTNTSVTEVENTAKEQISQCSNWSIVFHVIVHYYDTCVFLIENPAYWDIQWWYLLLMFRTNTSVTENTAKEQISQLNVQIKS